MFTPNINRAPFNLNLAPQAETSAPVPPQAPDTPRMVQYWADASGCGAWRMAWPSHLLNFHEKANVQESTVMIAEPRWYTNTKVVRVQRQATPHQLEFIKYLKQVQQEHGFRIVYEVDDVIFREDIPNYNKFKFAFESDEIRNSALEIISLCDEVTVTCDFMRKYYQGKTGKSEITVIPNFPPQWWMGNFFNITKLEQNFNLNRKRPRILYAGSGAHFDVDNKTNQRDDFEHVIDAIINTRHKYKWVFLGAYPMRLDPYIRNGDLEFHPWQRIYEYPKKIASLNVQMMVAPLQNNNFNKAKSDLKFIEGCCYGIPVACQDMCTYQDADTKFNTGTEMIDCIERELSHLKSYKEKAYTRRLIAEDRFLELDKNIDCYLELINHPYGSDKRVNLKRYN